MNQRRHVTPEEQLLWNQAMSGTFRVESARLPQSAIKTVFEPSAGKPPSRTLDLHGLTVADAYQAVICHISLWRDQTKNVTVITGRSGRIAEEFPSWLQNLSEISQVLPLNGGGAFKLIYRKKIARP
jgi:DNA-nicking Smr family endonuclease